MLYNEPHFSLRDKGRTDKALGLRSGPAEHK